MVLGLDRTPLLPLPPFDTRYKDVDICSTDIVVVVVVVAVVVCTENNAPRVLACYGISPKGPRQKALPGYGMVDKWQESRVPQLYGGLLVEVQEKEKMKKKNGTRRGGRRKKRRTEKRRK